MNLNFDIVMLPDVLFLLSPQPHPLDVWPVRLGLTRSKYTCQTAGWLAGSQEALYIVYLVIL